MLLRDSKQLHNVNSLREYDAIIALLYRGQSGKTHTSTVMEAQ